MKYDKFFQLAKQYGIEEAEISVSESNSLSIQLFHGEIVNYSNNNATNIYARGIINGKFGTAICDAWNNDKCEYLVKQIKENALVIENDDPAIIFGGSPKYHKISTYNKDLENVPTKTKIDDLKRLEAEVRKADKRIIEVGSVGYQEQHQSFTILNSKGLKLTQKTNMFYAYADAVAQQGEQVKSGFDLFLNNDYSKFNVEELAKSIAKKTCMQLGGEACESGAYKTILSPEVTGTLLQAYIDHASSDDVQKNSSLFIGKLGEKVASNKVTVIDAPLAKTVFARYFDDEGVATSNKNVIKNGTLETYFYNLKTAAKGNTESTGNGFRGGTGIGCASAFLELKAGKKSQEELFQEIGNGVYITDVSGLHAGLNPQSGNFSLQSTGFLIKDGKLDRGLDIITLSGNLMQLFKDIKEVGSDSQTLYTGVKAPSVFVKSLNVGGK